MNKPGKEKRSPAQRAIDEIEDESEGDEPEEKSEQPSNYEESSDVRDFAGYDQDLQNWIASEQLERRSYTACLYKYDPINRAKQWLVDTTRDEIMSAHDVGMQFGSGEYRYLITFKSLDDRPPRVKGYKFNIHPCYDERRRKAGINVAEVPNALTASKNMSGFAEAGEMFKSFVEIIKPIIHRDEGGGSMIQNYQMMNEVLKNQLLETVKMHRELVNKATSPTEPEGDDEDMPEETTPNWIEQIMPLLDQWLPKLLGKGPQSQLTAATIKALPQFKQIVKDKSKFKGLCAELDKEMGKEKLDAVLAKLKMKRPE